MWSSQPNFTKEQLSSIKILTWIVAGGHDEATKCEDTELMAVTVPNAGVLIQPWVNHFAFLQGPAQFSYNVLHFLEKRPPY